MTEDFAPIERPGPRTRSLACKPVLQRAGLSSLNGFQRYSRGSKRQNWSSHRTDSSIARRHHSRSHLHQSWRFTPRQYFFRGFARRSGRLSGHSQIRARARPRLFPDPKRVNPCATREIGWPTTRGTSTAHYSLSSGNILTRFTACACISYVMPL